MQTKIRVEYGFGCGEDKTGKEISKRRLKQNLDFLIGDAARRFGGVTVTRTAGAWLNSEDRIVGEPGCTFMALLDQEPTKKDQEKQSAKIYGFAQLIKGVMQQEAIFLTVSSVNSELV